MLLFYLFNLGVFVVCPVYLVLKVFVFYKDPKEGQSSETEVLRSKTGGLDMAQLGCLAAFFALMGAVLVFGLWFYYR